MPSLVWNQWGRELAISSALVSILGSIFGFFIRRYFFSMIGMVNIVPGQGIVPGISAAIPVFFIVNLPVVQSINIFNALLILALEYPIPFLSGTMIHRSLFLRLILFLWSGFSASLVYQSFIASVFYSITFLVYLIAFSKGEKIDDGLDNLSRKAPV